jgi:hypothetical protein
MKFRPLIFLVASISPPSQSLRQLDEAYAEYRALKQPPSVEKLVGLDQKLRELINRPWQERKELIDGKYWKPHWVEMGIGVGHYSDSLHYSGKLLAWAHKVDPNSRFRAHTLYSATGGDGGSSGLGEMPNLRMALRYVQEFPEGLFIEETYTLLGNFYSDLFQLIKDLGKHQGGYKYDCFAKYVDKSNLDSQLRKAQRLSVGYYSQALVVNPKNKDVREWLVEMKEGRPTGWHFCAD